MAGARLVRPRDHKIIAGVAAGIAERFGISRFMVRLTFVITGFVGAGELVYVLLWFIIPKEK